MRENLFRHIVSLALLILLLILVYGSTGDSDRSTLSRKDSKTNNTGPPNGCDASGVVINGWILCLFRMSTQSFEMYQAAAESFTGKGYSFMVLGFDGENAKDKFTWHCWMNKIIIELADGTESRTIDISDMENFYRWDYHKFFPCTKTIYPGKKELLCLAFYPSFSWKNVRKVTFQTGALGMGIREGHWIESE